MRRENRRNHTRLDVSASPLPPSSQCWPVVRLKLSLEDIVLGLGAGSGIISVCEAVWSCGGTTGDWAGYV